MGLEKKIDDELRKVAGSTNGEIITDYSKMELGTSIAFDNYNSGAIMLRIRKKFQKLNESSSPATLDYVDDRKTEDSGSRLQAAFMLDFYLPHLYNREGLDFGITTLPYRLWIRTGFEIDKNDLPGVNEVDQQKFFGLLNFQANPDQNIFSGHWFEVHSPQIIQLGGVYEQNRLSGEESGHWIIGWSPVFRVLDESENPFSGFGLNKRMYFGEKGGKTKVLNAKTESQGTAQKFVAQVETESNSDFYTSIDPGFEFLGKSDARGIGNELAKRLKKTRSLKTLEKLQEEQFNWHLKALAGWKNGTFELSYAVTGSHPLSNLGESHIGQEVRADFNFTRYSNPNGKDWRDFTAYASYRRGQFEPTFEDQDLFTAGISLRF